ncbi:MAG TPA: hypothetical protein VFF72_06675, partial [Caldimonas sp.]|nr:hypothetical protein [Caldimonas sp.]
YPLGVECRACGHKGLIPAERFGGCKGDMTQLERLRLACMATPSALRSGGRSVSCAQGARGRQNLIPVALPR